jgi:hypothetical protein
VSETREFRQARFTPPSGACEILLVRHGESAPAVEGASFTLVDGHGDPPLDPDIVFLISHYENRVLRGALYRRIVALVDGRRTTDAIVEALCADYPAA